MQIKILENEAMLLKIQEQELRGEEEVENRLLSIWCWW